jgi:hypothetical protein
MVLANKNKLERRRAAEQRKKQLRSQRIVQTIRPYIMPVLYAGVVVAAWQDPGKVYQFALWAFVLYWISILFAHWAEHGMGMIRTQPLLDRDRQLLTVNTFRQAFRNKE